MLAKSNDEIEYMAEHVPSRRLIFSFGPAETNGIEDARFVHFQDDDGVSRYFAICTASDGKLVLPQLLETSEFPRFRMHTFNGPAIADKGFALFRGKIGGHFAMLSRHDGEHLFLMYPDMLYFRHAKQMIVKPANPWEFVQMGNCGSPIETNAGWLVLSHGVGPMCEYSIGVILLDLDDPSKIIGRLQQPLLEPNESEREGYVSNVVCCCGAVAHKQHRVLPCSMSDHATTFATIEMNEFLETMLNG